MKKLNRTAFIFGMIIIQFCIFPRFFTIFFEPDLLLAIIVLVSLHRSAELSCTLAFLLGLMMDVHTGEILGGNAFIFTQTAMLNASIRKYLVYDSIPVQLSVTATSYLLAGCLQFILFRFTSLDEPGSYFFLVILSRALITAIFAIPLSLMMSRLGFFPEKTHA